MKFINNKEENGLFYDTRLVEKEYNKLKVPKEFFRPPFQMLDKAKYFIELSERGTGKTTQLLLLAMCYNKLYDTRAIYVRETREMIAPKYAMEIFNVIQTYNAGYYIRQLTNERYNSIVYDTRRYFYCYRNEEGEIEEKASNPFMHSVSVDDAMKLKSTFNVPLGDIIIYDEFIGKRYNYDNGAIQFFDLCSTIIRKRISPMIFLLANTIDLHSEWFYELEIVDKINNMKYGDNKLITTELGTKIFIEMITIKDNNEKIRRAEHNSLFFGFTSPKLTSITGGSEVWAFERVPHIFKYSKDGNLVKKEYLDHPAIYIRTTNELLQLKFCYTDEYDTFLEVTRATYIKDKPSTIVLVDNHTEILYNNEYKAFAHGTKLYNVVMDMLTYGRVYFQNNMIGSIFYNYIDNIKEF